MSNIQAQIDALAVSIQILDNTLSNVTGNTLSNYNQLSRIVSQQSNIYNTIYFGTGNLTTGNLTVNNDYIINGNLTCSNINLTGNILLSNGNISSTIGNLILSNGNFGLKRNNPQYELDVNGSGNISGNLITNGNANIIGNVTLGSVNSNTIQNTIDMVGLMRFVTTQTSRLTGSSFKIDFGTGTINNAGFFAASYNINFTNTPAIFFSIKDNTTNTRITKVLLSGPSGTTFTTTSGTPALTGNFTMDVRNDAGTLVPSVTVYWFAIGT
jgi:hypothetical protein